MLRCVDFIITDNFCCVTGISPWVLKSPVIDYTRRTSAQCMKSVAPGRVPVVPSPDWRAHVHTILFILIIIIWAEVITRKFSANASVMKSDKQQSTSYEAAQICPFKERKSCSQYLPCKTNYMWLMKTLNVPSCSRLMLD